ncbi:hypothetical protein, partial [Leptospira sp. id769339]
GIYNSDNRRSLVEQIIESERRVKYISVIKSRGIAAFYADTRNSYFDPYKASIVHQNIGDVEEAFWLIFIATHFGKNKRHGWSYARAVYGALNSDSIWNWDKIKNNVAVFKEWLKEKSTKIESLGGGFGNHRKYESLTSQTENGSGAVIESYVNWVSEFDTHVNLFSTAIKHSNGNEYEAFNHIYKLMGKVKRFGRTAKFDYLTMIGKMKLAAIKPGSPFLQGATGPLTGAKTLFLNSTEVKIRTVHLEEYVKELGNYLRVGMQEMEDSLCNWQKSPSKFKPFRG